MESLDTEKQAEPEKAKKAPSGQSDRISLGKSESAKIEGWIKQIDEKTGGMLKLSKADLVNYLVQRKDAELSPSEITQIRKDNYDEVKFAYWALSKIKEAKKAGETITLEDLMRVQKGLGKAVKESSPSAETSRSRKFPKPESQDANSEKLE